MRTELTLRRTGPADTVVSPRIILTATIPFPASARLAINLSRAGCTVDALCPAGHPLARTSAVRRRYPYHVLRPLRALTEAILEDPDCLIIPCDDDAVRHMHRLHEISNEKGSPVASVLERSLGDPGSYATTTSRAEFMGFARRIGLRVPDGGPVTSPEDLRKRYADVPLPWVLKIEGTWGGGGIEIIDTMEQADHVLFHGTRIQRAKAVNTLLVDHERFALRRALQRARPSPVLQRYIRGVPANCLSFCWKGEVKALLAAEVLQSQGPTGAATVIKLIEHPEITACATAIAKELGLSGLHGLDFILEEDSRAAWLIEMNPRATQIAHINAGPGHDLVGAIATAVSGRACQGSGAPAQDNLIALFPQAWLQDPTNPLLRSASHDVPWEDVDLVRELIRQPWHQRGWLPKRALGLVRKLPTRRYRDELGQATLRHMIGS